MTHFNILLPPRLHIQLVDATNARSIKTRLIVPMSTLEARHLVCLSFVRATETIQYNLRVYLTIIP